ncbi:MAG: alpha/beta hydrolase domain-containing protein [Casimicrobiaceae bacterium]
MQTKSQQFRLLALSGALLAAGLIGDATPVHARVTRLVIDAKTSPAFGGATFGSAGQYETIAGHVFGELDPNDSHNSIINDIHLAPKNAAGKVEYMATFFLVKPIDMSKSSHLLWQDVPNRGGRITLAAASRNDGDVGLSSGWQGDNSGETAQIPPPANDNDYAVVPVAKNADGSPITGMVMGRIMNVGGVNSQPIIEHSNPIPYKPMTLATTDATLESHDHETIDGIVQGVTNIQSSDWAWASCSAANPFPGTPDPTQICVKGGFLPDKLYQVVYKAKDPYILAIGTAAFRDAASFFRYETQDDFGTPNPLAGQIGWVITRGSSQSGTFVRQLIHYGFTQDEANRQVYDGAWPIVAARRIGLNFRFAKPDLVMKLYEAGSEGPLWWHKFPDQARGLPPGGILDRCERTKTCPKIVEHFGAAEVWGQKLTTGWVGTGAKGDIPLPKNVRRYYFGSSPHGGGNGGFSVTPGSIPNCSSMNYGPGTFPSNPLPQTQTVNALRYHFRNWVMNGTRPPDSVYPTLTNQTLVEPTKAAMGFPDIPAVLASSNPRAPEYDVTGSSRFIQAMLQYDWGPTLDYSENIGFHAFEPPIVKQVIDQVVPRTDRDGNEIGGVPVVLLEAPLGTYLGWNITATGFHKGQVCNYQGGWIPFAKTLAERMVTGDPRLSLTERYGNHAGYVAAVTAAADRIMAQGFLLKADRDALVAAAAASNVLNP